MADDQPEQTESKERECEHYSEEKEEKKFRVKHPNADMSGDCEFYFKCCSTCANNMVKNLLVAYYKFMKVHSMWTTECPAGGGHLFPGFAQFAILEEVDKLEDLLLQEVSEK